MAELDRYRTKRDFGRTPEPAGGRDGEEAGASARRFVVQKHGARRTHFDLRLEVAGALKSWAVPKGPSADPGTKRLAVEVEDHPLEYGDFEGVIPKGEYGAGPVIIWDRGRYVPYGLTEDSDDAIDRAVRDGKLEFELLGERLRGRWALVRMKGRDGDKNWLLLKKKDVYAEPGDAEGLVSRYPDSVVSGRALEDQAAAEPASESAARPPIDTRPMLAHRDDQLPEGAAWCYELKLDGIRAVCWARPDGTVQIYSRRGRRLETAFPEVGEALELLARRTGSEFVVDGEIVAVTADGAPSFGDLQPRFNLRDEREIAHWARARPAEMYAFDLLWLDGTDLRDEPLSERKDRLRRLLKAGGRSLRYSAHDVGRGSAMTERARAEGWEGVVGKRLKSRYRSGERSRDWVKVKNVSRQEFVVCGWTEPQGGRTGFGALVVGYYEYGAEAEGVAGAEAAGAVEAVEESGVGASGAGRLLPAGRVGTGFDEETLGRLSERLRELEQPTPPLAEVPADLEDAHWVGPELVVEVAYQEWTRDGRLRQPVFLGLREDIEPTHVVREGVSRGEVRGPPVEVDAGLASVIEALETIEREDGDGEVVVDDEPLRVTNLAKVLWPETGVTKGRLLRYYASVAPAILPVVADRPLVLERYPDGIEGEMFYQQRAPDPAPGPVRTETIESEGERVDRLIAGGLYTLLYTAQLAAISQHVWASRVSTLDHADYTVLDLDPDPELPFSAVREVALAARDELERLGLRGYPKTSGARGVHVVIPLTAGTSYETARLLAELLARLVGRARPNISTLQRVVSKRGKRVYLDYLQNIRGRTVASAYSVRPRAGAPVSAPLRWTELEAEIEPEQFNVETMAERLSEVGDLWAACRSDSNDVREVLELL